MKRSRTPVPEEQLILATSKELYACTRGMLRLAEASLGQEMGRDHELCIGSLAQAMAAQLGVMNDRLELALRSRLSAGQLPATG